MKLCVDCMFSDFRLSHVRRHDFRHILMLQWPVRCCRCGRRTYGWLPLALKLLLTGQHAGHLQGHTSH